MNVKIFLAGFLFIPFVFTNVETIAPPLNSRRDPSFDVETKLALNTITLPPELKRIAWCESRNRQYDSRGNVLTGKYNPADRGILQINLLYHQRAAELLNYNLNTETGNRMYGIYLYNTLKGKPWSWSFKCHGII